MDMKATTIYDIAKVCNCSPATVSLALNDDKRVADKTKKRVRDIAKEMGYQPSYFGRSLITGKSNAIKVVVPDLHNPVFVNIVDGVEQYINDIDCHMILEATNNNVKRELSSFDSLLENKVDGIIISPIYEKEVTDYLLDKRIDLNRIVYVGNTCTNSDKIHYYAADSRKGAYIGVKNMIENGCKRVAFLAPTVEKLQGSKRRAGYLEAMEEFGLVRDENLLINCKQEFAEIYRYAYKLIREQKADGIFCLYDYAALPVLKAAVDIGVRVPDDLMVTGYDNIDLGEYFERPLTTVDPHQKAQGYHAAELLMGLLNGEDCPVHNIMEPTLIVRSTTRKCGIN